MELAAKIRVALVKVLTIIQETSGAGMPEMTDSLRPLLDLEDFNSEVWPIASGMLQIELAIQIPAKINIFEEPLTKKALSISEIVKRIEANFEAWSPAAPLVSAGEK